MWTTFELQIVDFGDDIVHGGTGQDGLQLSAKPDEMVAFGANVDAPVRTAVGKRFDHVRISVRIYFFAFSSA